MVNFFLINCCCFKKLQIRWDKFFSVAPQVAPRNFKVTAVSPYCVSLSYDPVLYPNGPESGLVYQVKQQ